MLKHCIEKLMAKKHLTAQEAEQGLTALLHSDNAAQQAAFLALLHSKGETAEELTGLVRALHMIAEPLELAEPILDIVGTGGDNAHTVNISTAAALVAASSGARVAKHGGRSVSSRCGSADVLESLGVNIQLDAEASQCCLDAAGIAFLFFRRFYPKAAALAPIRQALGIRTTINLLGPLLNPCRTQGHMLIGVSSLHLLTPLAETVQALGFRRSLVVHGSGLDELTPLGPIDAVEVHEGQTRRFVIDPLDLGMKRCELSDLKGGGPERNAQKIVHVFTGHQSPLADAIALTAGTGLHLYGAALTVAEGVAMAQETLSNGATLKTLDQLKAASNRDFKEVVQ